MAGESKQIYQLTSGTFNGSSLVPFEVPNTDSSTSAEKPYITRKTTGDEVSEFVAKTQEFETDLETDNKTIIGAINELKEGGGGNANYVELTQAEYDELTEEEKHNGKMYFITDGGSDGSIIDDETTSTETTWSSQKIDGAIDEVNNRFTPSRTSGSLTPSRSDVANWNTSIVDLPLSRAYSVNITFEVSTTAQPSITHNWNGNPITGGNLIAYRIDGSLSGSGNSGTISGGMLRWASGMKQGIYVAIGTLTY